MKLSLVIPVWNDPIGLKRLLAQVRDMQVFHQIIISDDGSEHACHPEDLGFVSSNLAQDLVYLRTDDQKGAGHARNQAIPHITGTHVVFFDSDDIFTTSFPMLIKDLNGETFDFCIYKHIENHGPERNGRGMFDCDEKLWRKAGADHVLGPVHADQYALLAGVAAYPWNKIYDVRFLQAHDIRCSETQVHNDIFLHWASFRYASRILSSNRRCCEHFVVSGGDRLTNSSGAERFVLFDLIDQVHSILQSTPAGVDFLASFILFYVQLLDWVLVDLEPAFRTEFKAEARRVILRHIDVDTYRVVNRAHDYVGGRINDFMRGV